MSGTNNKPSKAQDENLETFSLIWVDEQVNKTEDNLRTQKQLRQIINHLKIFDDQQKCQQYILSLSQHDRMILIVSGRFGRILVPQIHHLRHVSSIYVYCMDKTGNELWAKNFQKIKSVIVKLNDLIQQIKLDQTSLIKLDEPLAINIFKANNNSDQSTSGLNGYFVHSLLLIDVLIRMKLIAADKRSLIKICRQQYHKNNSQLNIIEEFQQNYTQKTALWWYTRECFLYNMLNKALRTQNIDLLFLFRFIICDIYQQLKQYQCQSPVRVYRGQIMSNDELNTLRRSIGEFISINSFFSTSIHRHEALKFSNIPNDLHRVIFIIDADPNVVRSKSFADISSFSEFKNEGEILFMIGSIYRLNRIYEDHDRQIWIIQMNLCDVNQHDSKELFDHMKQDYGGGDKEVNLRSFGTVLQQMGKFDLAEKMYCRLLDELPSNDSAALSDVYWSLGTVTKDKGDYDSSLQWYNKSLEIKIRTNSCNYVSIGDLYNWIGLVHWHKNDHKIALTYYNIAAELFQQAHDENHLTMAHIYNNMAIIYHDEKKYSEALEYYIQSLDIYNKHLPSHHPDLARSYNNIGSVHVKLKEYDLAIEYHNRSLAMRRRSLPPQHPDMATSYESIGVIHENKCEWQQALISYEKAATIYRHSLPPQHPDVIRINQCIDRIPSAFK